SLSKTISSAQWASAVEMPMSSARIRPSRRFLGRSPLWQLRRLLVLRRVEGVGDADNKEAPKSLAGHSSKKATYLAHRAGKCWMSNVPCQMYLSNDTLTH